MDIICEHCETKINIPDHKIPPGKKASFLCPKCGQRIYVTSSACQIDTSQRDTNDDSSGNGSIPVAPRPRRRSGTGDYDASNKPFDFLDENDKTVLVCMKDNESAKTVERAFNDMDYHLISVPTAEMALTRMKYHIFDSVVFDDEFDKSHEGTDVLMNDMGSLDMAIRRRIFAVFISSKSRTMDNMAAFHASVNLIINQKDLNNMEKIVRRNLKEHEQFYSVFNDTLKLTNKI